MLEGNLLIRASAGTGKTFSLATRYIRLMLIDKVEPSRIIALTFSRAAAEEIYTKILERLWEAASSEENAKDETKTLLKGLDYAESWTKEEFAKCLRELIDVQHLGAIATLDSFILRIVRNFPVETGFEHAVEVLDGLGEQEEVDLSLRKILSKTKGSEKFINAFIAAREGNLPRVLKFKIASILSKWHKFYVDNPKCKDWTVESMCKALDIPSVSTLPDLTPLFALRKRSKLWNFADKLPDYDGEKIQVPEVDGAELTEEQRAAFEAGLKYMFEVYARKVFKKVKAQLEVVSLVEEEYDKACRRKGKLTFSDFTRYSAAKEGSKEALAKENLEFRFDSKFDHWALDEFQDTSELQWRCLKNLVESAANSGEGRTVMTVGDLKQSIYTWRGGNDAPFKEMMSWPSFKIEDANTSYRYEGNICDFLNGVFGPKNMMVERWLAEDCWKEHKPVIKDGKEKRGDYVKVVKVDTKGESKLEAILPALTEELKRVWKEHEAKDSTESVGVLVRKNEDGSTIAEHLRAHGFKVVWEGMNSVANVPVVNALIDLIRLSEHSEDKFSWVEVSRIFPIVKTLFAGLVEEPSAAFVSQRVATDLSHQGLARTLKNYVRKLSVPEVGLDRLSLMRLRDMVRAAVTYEQRSMDRFSIDGFASYLAQSTKRELGASSKVIRILTIHRSKGLTLDRVFVPIVESDKSVLNKIGDTDLVYGDGWAFPSLNEKVAALNPRTKEAYNRLCEEELLANIRNYYVALTRARKAMYVFVPDVKDEKLRFRYFLESGFPENEKGEEPPFEKKETKIVARKSWAHEDAGAEIERTSPSSFGHKILGEKGLSASGLFSEEFGIAAEKGSDAHKTFSSIEWGEEAPFVKPSKDAEVWREKSYEIYREQDGKGVWESGQFDRVVFYTEDGERRAIIYDFKTNKMRRGESQDAFERRMKETYAYQMNNYREALKELTGLDMTRISTSLYLTATSSLVEVPRKMV